MAADHRLEELQRIPRPRAEVFAFFSDAANLERLTPPFVHFHILSKQPIAIAQVDEDHPAVVAPAIHPAGDRDLLADELLVDPSAVM